MPNRLICDDFARYSRYSGRVLPVYTVPTPPLSMATITSRRVPTSQFLIGGLIALVGVLLLLQTTGLFATRNILLYVPSLFVVLGIWMLVQSRFHSLVGPVTLIGVAGGIQLIVLDYATVDQLVVYWPVLVIALGLSLAIGQFRSRVQHTDDSFSSGFAIFGGVEKRNTSKTFTGGDLTAIFGGTELDLRDATVATPPARINATVLFGDAEIVVPEEWNVRVDAVPIFGDASDRRRRHADTHEEADLVVTGLVAFGDITVRD